MTDTNTKPFIPDMQAVKSSNIASVGYHAPESALFIRFKSGGLYRYEDVPPEAHRAFMEAESYGRHFSQTFAGKFKHTKVE